MKPSALFHTIQREIEKQQLDDASILELHKKLWPEICKEIKLGNKIRNAFTDNEGRAITSVAIEDYLGSLVGVHER